MRSKSTLTVFTVALSVAAQECVRFVQGVAFWTAVALPILYVALLITGSPRVADPFTVAEMASLNVVTLVLGHSYGNPASRG